MLTVVTAPEMPLTHLQTFHLCTAPWTVDDPFKCMLQLAYVQELIWHAIRVQCVAGGQSAWDAWARDLLQDAVRAAPLDLASVWAIALRYGLHGLCQQQHSGIGRLLELVADFPGPGASLVFQQLWGSVCARHAESSVLSKCLLTFIPRTHCALFISLEWGA